MDRSWKVALQTTVSTTDPDHAPHTSEPTGSGHAETTFIEGADYPDPRRASSEEPSGAGESRLPAMSMANRDYLLRAIQRMAQALAAILARRTEGKTDEALALLERARVEMFGSMRDALDAVDATSVASLIGVIDKARAYATFCAVEANLHADRGEEKAAARARRRALAVYREAAARFPGEVTDANREAMAKLRASEAKDQRASGSRSVKVVPPSGARGATHTSPPCASTIRFTTASPSPVPVALVVKNGWKTWPASSAGMPGPSSLTSTRTRGASPASVSARTATRPPPAWPGSR